MASTHTWSRRGIIVTLFARRCSCDAMMNVKRVLSWTFLVQVVAQHTAGVFASQDLLVHDLRIRLFVSDRALLPPLTLRGGASEPTRQAWSAGSKYSRPNNLSSSSPTRSYQTPSYGQGQDEKEATTKDAFAEAFLQREDRNRFIGEESPCLWGCCYLYWYCALYSHIEIFYYCWPKARVYAILSGQLLFTAGAIHAFHLLPGVRDWMLWHPAGRKG